jgi:phosphatidylglycerol:prolipoprotein diacylglycerol transferase
MHPILFQLGWFRLSTYGVLVALAFLAAIYTVLKLGKREGLDPGRLLDFNIWLLAVGIIGAKVLMVVTDPGFRTLADVFSWSTLEAAGVFYGGFLAATLFAIWYIRTHKLPAWKVVDIYAPAIALGQSVGRLGCFAAGCDYGRPTNSILGVVFTSQFAHDVTGVPLGIRVFPTQIFESVATFAIFAILLWRYRKKRRDGEIFLLYLALYAVARFLLEFLRGDEDRGFVFNHLLSTSQFIAVLMLLTSAALAYHLWARPPRTLQQETDTKREETEPGTGKSLQPKVAEAGISAPAQQLRSSPGAQPQVSRPNRRVERR